MTKDMLATQSARDQLADKLLVALASRHVAISAEEKALLESAPGKPRQAASHVDAGVLDALIIHSPKWWSEIQRLIRDRENSGAQLETAKYVLERPSVWTEKDPRDSETRSGISMLAAEVAVVSEPALLMRPDWGQIVESQDYRCTLTMALNPSATPLRDSARAALIAAAPQPSPPPRAGPYKIRIPISRDPPQTTHVDDRALDALIIHSRKWWPEIQRLIGDGEHPGAQMETAKYVLARPSVWQEEDPRDSETRSVIYMLARGVAVVSEPALQMRPDWRQIVESQDYRNTLMTALNPSATPLRASARAALAEAASKPRPPSGAGPQKVRIVMPPDPP